MLLNPDAIGEIASETEQVNLAYLQGLLLLLLLLLLSRAHVANGQGV